MRMATDHFSGDRLDDVAESKRAFLFGHTGVKDHLQQQIAEFVAEVGEVVARDGVGHLIGFLDRVGRNGRKGLLEVPRTTADRCAQGSHDFDEAGDVAGRRHAEILACGRVWGITRR